MQQPKPSTLSQLVASTIYFLQKQGVDIPASVEVPLAKHLAGDWKFVAPPQVAR